MKQSNKWLYRRKIQTIDTLNIHFAEIERRMKEDVTCYLIFLYGRISYSTHIFMNIKVEKLRMQIYNLEEKA